MCVVISSVCSECTALGWVGAEKEGCHMGLRVCPITDKTGGYPLLMDVHSLLALLE